MRCKKHPSDLSSSVGICASCLHERLLALIAAQEEAQQHAQLVSAHSRAALDDSRKSDAHPPPLLFPRSVSPYVARRKSDDASWSSHHHLRFYSTPQVGPTYNSSTTTTTTTGFSISRTSRNKQGRFSLLSNLFRSRSEKLNPDPFASGPGVPSRNSTEASSSSPSWFSAIFSTRRKKQSAEYSGVAAGHKPRQRMDRGMSPAREGDCEEDCEDCDPSPWGSGSSSESSHWWKRTPVTQAGVRRGKPGQGKSVPGLAFCLSPLVRASPNRHWNQKGGLPSDRGFATEVRIPVKPHMSTAASFCANRSRKLCDFGRATHNR